MNLAANWSEVEPHDFNATLIGNLITSKPDFGVSKQNVNIAKTRSYNVLPTE